MKKLLLILLFVPFIGFGQQTYVPDDNFEQELINQGYDSILNDYVTTANINTVTSLVVASLNIADLTGIEGFVALIDLNCQSNQLTSLDVSTNTALQHLHCDYNQLTNLNVSNNTALNYLDCGGNLLTNLDVSNNTALTYLYSHSNQLTNLNVSNNTALTYLYCPGNLLTNLDVSNNTALTFLHSHSNQLTSLDVRNGNNLNVTVFDCTINPQLYCIDVDDVGFSTANWTVANGNINSTMFFSINCPPIVFGCMDTLACNYNPSATIDDSSCFYAPNVQINQVGSNLELYATGGTSPYMYLWSTLETSQTITPGSIGNYWCVATDINNCVSDTAYFYVVTIPTYINEDDTKKNLQKVINLLGTATKQTNQPLFYIYDDGTVEKRIVIE